MTATVALAPVAKQRFADNNGAPLAGGKVFTYAAGTTTKQPSYTDSTASTPNLNPVILDSRGEASIWFDQTLSYKVVLAAATDTDPPTTPIWTIDNIAGNAAGNSPYVESFGATGLDVANPLSNRFLTLAAAQAVYGAAAVALTDEIDGVVLQYLINSGTRFQGSPGAIYRTSRGIQLSTGTSGVGAKRWSAAATTQKYVGTSTIKYVGAGGTDSYVVLASTQPVGILPTDPATRALQNVRFTDWTIDGNDIAWYDLIEIRAGQGNDFSRLTLTNARVCHNVMELGFVTGSDEREIYLGRGAGLYSGKDVWSWGVATTDDQISMKDWFVNFIGCDQTGVPFNQFHDNGASPPSTANTDIECGMSIYGARAIRFINCQINQCSGIALVVTPTLTGPIVIEGGYMETNGRSSGASQHWYTWIVSSVGSSGVRIRDVSFSGTAPAHRITGVQPSRISEGPRFENCPLIGTVYTDTTFTNWNMVDCDQTAVVVGGSPKSPIMTLGGIQFGIGTGEARLWAYREPTSFASVGLAGATVAGTGWSYSVGNNFLTVTRIGRLVFYEGIITLTAVSTTATGQICITGLPFLGKTGQGYHAAMSTSKTANLATAVVSLTGDIIPGTSTIGLWVRTAASTSERALVLSDLTATTTFVFSGFYPTDDL